MEEASENGKESLHSACDSGMNKLYTYLKFLCIVENTPLMFFLDVILEIIFICTKDKPLHLPMPCGIPLLLNFSQGLFHICCQDITSMFQLTDMVPNIIASSICMSWRTFVAKVFFTF
jgi:hypothetical protein